MPPPKKRKTKKQLESEKKDEEVEAETKPEIAPEEIEKPNKKKNNKKKEKKQKEEKEEKKEDVNEEKEEEKEEKEEEKDVNEEEEEKKEEEKEKTKKKQKKGKKKKEDEVVIEPPLVISSPRKKISITREEKTENKLSPVVSKEKKKKISIPREEKDRNERVRKPRTKKNSPSPSPVKEKSKSKSKSSSVSVPKQKPNPAMFDSNERPRIRERELSEESDIISKRRGRSLTSSSSLSPSRNRNRNISSSSSLSPLPKKPTTISSSSSLSPPPRATNTNRNRRISISSSLSPIPRKKKGTALTRITEKITEPRKRGVYRADFTDSEENRRSRRRRSKPPPVDQDEDTEDIELSKEERDNKEAREFLRQPPTEEELQDEYRALLKRAKRLYPYLDIELPSKGTPSRRLRRLYNYYVDEIATAEGLEKYQIIIVIVAAVIEGIGLKFGLQAIKGYANLQYANMASYHAMLIELGDRNYFGFASGWPVEVRIGGMMLLNAIVLVLGRWMLEGETMNILLGALTNNRRVPGPTLDKPSEANGDGASLPGLGGGDSMGGLGGMIAGLLGGAGGGGGGGGLGGMISQLMGGMMGNMGQGGQTNHQPREQGAPQYSRRRRTQTN